MKKILSFSIIILGIIGFWGVSKISYLHATGEPCPMLGVLPACYVIFIGYAMIIISMLPKVSKPKTVFLIGWIPVIVIALIGIIGELTQTMQCAQSETGIPKCFYSAGFSAIIGVLGYLFFKKNKG